MNESCLRVCTNAPSTQFLGALNNMTSISDKPLRGEKVTFEEDGIKYEYMAVNGIGFPPFPSFQSPEGSVQRIEDIQNLDVRPDDVLLATYPKCGTHWANEIINMLLQEKADYQKLSKGGFMLELVPSLDITRNMASPRVLNTHVIYEWFPRQHIENGGKIVHVTRNPKDAYVSYFYHTMSVLEHGPATKNMSWKQFFNSCILQKRLVYGSWFQYERSMAKAKKVNKNIYTVHFENLKEDPVKEIKALGHFLGVEVTDELSKEIAVKCNFQNLKKADEDLKELPKEIMEEIMKMKKADTIKGEMPTIYRKGIVGDWKNMFTVAQNEQFDEMFKEEMKDIDLDVIFKI